MYRINFSNDSCWSVLLPKGPPESAYFLKKVAEVEMQLVWVSMTDLHVEALTSLEGEL